MKQALVFALLGAGLLACGAAHEDFDNDTDIGTAEQEINIGNGGHGVNNQTNRFRCAQPGTSSQVCFTNAVASKSVGYCTQGFSASDDAAISAAIVFIDGQTNWSFTKTSFPCVLNISKGAVAGGSSANVENFVRFTPGGVVAPLTSPAGVSHINGTWSSFTKATVTIDVDKLVAAENPIRHAGNMAHFGGHLADLFLGLGTQQDPAGINFASRRLVMLDFASGANNGLSAGEKCRTDNTTAATAGQVSAVFGCATF